MRRLPARSGRDAALRASARCRIALWKASSRAEKSGGKYNAASYAPDCTRAQASARASADSWRPSRGKPKCSSSRLATPRIVGEPLFCEQGRSWRLRSAGVSPAGSGRDGRAPGCASRQVLRPDHQDSRRLFLHELGDLEHAHPQQRIEQNRKDRDHEQRAPVAQLIANFLHEYPLDVGKAHGAGVKSLQQNEWQRGQSHFRRDRKSATSRLRRVAKSTGRIVLRDRSARAARGFPPAFPRPGCCRDA